MNTVPKLPRHTKSKVRDYAQTGTPLWGATTDTDFDPPKVWGQYPQGFIPWACRCMGARPESVLHVCSGALQRGEGCRVDIRAGQRPDVVADGRSLPFADETWPAVLIDPPYTEEYARGLYQTDYPRPLALIREAARVLSAGGAIGFLHFQVPLVHGTPLSYERIWGITTGPGYAARAFTVMRKPQAQLL